MPHTERFLAMTDQSVTEEREAAPPPRWLAELAPRTAPPPGSNGMEFVFGHWPGNETEEEVEAILKAIE